MEEIWKDIPEYDGLYQISNFGNVRSQHHNHMNGQKPGKLLKVHITKNGYVSLELRMMDTNKRHLIHRLIAEAFIPNPDNKKEVNHINGVKTDNRIENLEWCTRSENMIHAHKSGLVKHWSKSINSEAVGRKISKSLTGKKLSESHKVKLSQAKLGKPSKKGTKILDTKTNVIYNSINDASVAVGIKYSALYAILKGPVKNKTTLILL